MIPFEFFRSLYPLLKTNHTVVMKNSYNGSSSEKICALLVLFLKIILFRLSFKCIGQFKPKLVRGQKSEIHEIATNYLKIMRQLEKNIQIRR